MMSVSALAHWGRGDKGRRHGSVGRSAALALSILGGMLLFSPPLLQGQSGDSRNLGGGSLGIQGYDPVAYFTEGRAVRGAEGISEEHQGGIYRFASEANRELFRQDPEAYLPAYGGWCAWAVGQGYLADIDPEAWVIHEGRLYLNFSRGINRRFTRDLEGNIRAADSLWPELAR